MERGYRGVSIDGEDAPGGWPMTYQDVAAAIDFIPQHKPQRCSLDLNNVVVAGYSAGGNLATWTCSRPELAPDAPGAIRPSRGQVRGYRWRL